MATVFELKTKEIEEKATAYLPEHMVEGFMRYVVDGIEPGGFLTAVLSNDLMETLNRADRINSRRLGDYALVLYNYSPGACFGSRKHVEAWVKMGGLNGLGAAPAGALHRAAKTREATD